MSAFPNSFSDCLVIRIDEPDLQKNQIGNIDNRTFILFDVESDKYFICGKRQDLNLYKNKKIYSPYSFFCQSESDTQLFIESILDHNCAYDIFDVSMSLYNYKNLPDTLETVDYDYLNSSLRQEMELYGNDQFSIQKQLPKYLRLLRKVRNL